MSEANGPDRAGSHPLPISKLRGVPPIVRLKLKTRRITTCPQLLAHAGDATDRAALSAATDIDEETLLRLVRRADMARINGIGTVFGLMLEEIGISDVQTLARQDAAELHAALRRYNLEQRLARRSPTLEEVATWVDTAKSLPVKVTYPADEPPVL